MDGFVASRGARAGRRCRDPDAPELRRQREVMGYHDGRDIPNYWTYARDFVLQDRIFEPNASWSLPQHLFMVSEWSAACDAAWRSDELRERAAVARLPPDFERRAPGARVGGRPTTPGPI